MSALVLKNDAVLNVPKVCEVILEPLQFQVVRQATYEDFAQLSVDLIATRQGLFPKLLNHCQFLPVLQYLVAGQGLSLRAGVFKCVHEVHGTFLDFGLSMCICCDVALKLLACDGWLVGGLVGTLSSRLVLVLLF